MSAATTRGGPSRTPSPPTSSSNDSSSIWTDNVRQEKRASEYNFSLDEESSKGAAFKSMEYLLDAWTMKMNKQKEIERRHLIDVQNVHLKEAMEKQTEALERISARLQWLDEEATRQAEEDREGWELQARDIDRRLKAIEKFEPVGERIARIEEKMKSQDAAMRDIHTRFERIRDLKSQLNEMESRRTIRRETSANSFVNGTRSAARNALLASHDCGTFESLSEKKSASPDGEGDLIVGVPNESLLLDLRDQISASVATLKKYLLKAEQTQEDKHAVLEHDRNVLDAYRDRENRRLIDRCVRIEAKLRGLEESAVEEQQSSLKALRVVLRSLRRGRKSKAGS